MLIGVPVMSKLIGMRDTFIVTIGAMSHAAGRVVFALAKIPKIFYMGKCILRGCHTQIYHNKIVPQVLLSPR